VAVTAAWMAIACAVQGWLWFARPAGVPRNPPVGPSLTLPRDGGDARLTQTFRLGTDGFNELTLYPVARAAAAGRVDLTLSDVSDEARARVVHRETVEARTIAAAASYRLSFAPVADSTGRLFQLDIAILNGATVGFRSVADNLYHDGALRVNGRPEWGDLAFEARATEDTPYRQFLARALPAGWPRGAAFWIALLLAYDALLAALLWRLVPLIMAPASPRPPHPAPGESAI
jgi:hypothetical protein